MAPLIPILLLVLAAVAFALAAFLRRRPSALPPGCVVYTDTDRRLITAPITSRRLRLTGKPDYIYVQQGSASPVEAKKHHAGKWGLRRQDIAQLMAYCVLIGEVWGLTVDHGFVEYSDQRFRIPYTPEARQAVLQLAEEIRWNRMAADVPRDHHDAWKCRRCGYSETCGQALVRR